MNAGGGTDMPDSVIILAGGKSKRWGGTAKYLLPVCGEPVLNRTVRLVKEIRPDVKVHVIGPELQRDNPNQVTAMVAHLWSEGMTYILLGDVSWMKGTLRRVLTTPTAFSIYGRAGPNPLTGRPHEEIFAFAFNGCLRQHIARIHLDSLCIKGENNQWDIVVLDDLYAQHPILYSLLMPFALWPGVYWYGMRRFGRRQDHPCFVDVGEGITDDFDEPEWYQPYRDAVEPGWLIDREVPP